MRTVVVLRGLRRKRRMIFDQTELTAKFGRLKFEGLLDMRVGVGGIRQFVMALDGGGSGDSNAQ